MPGQTKYVCEECIEDPALQKLVTDNAESLTCSYCDKESDEPIACDMEIVMERIQWAIDEMCTDPAAELGYDGREGGYQGEWFNGAYELLQEGIEYYPANEQLGEDILDGINGESFCWKDPYGPSGDEWFQPSWEQFEKVVKHVRRYTFWNIDAKDELRSFGSISPGDLMETIGEMIHRVCSDTLLTDGTRFWRVRVHSTTLPLTSDSDFTSPPLTASMQPNRMSPAGIPMFYGTEDFGTALAETVDPSDVSGKAATGVQFESLVELNILDLMNIPAPLSFFDDWELHKRDAAKFLRSFAFQLSQPVAHDERQHIDYVPTQVFTEFIRYELRTHSGQPYHGIKYRSSRNRRGCYVFFLNQSDCLPCPAGSPHPQVLRFVDGSVHTMPLAP